MTDLPRDSPTVPSDQKVARSRDHRSEPLFGIESDISKVASDQDSRDLATYTSQGTGERSLGTVRQGRDRDREVRSIEPTLRTMTKTQRRAYLTAHGWRCISNRPPGWWSHPDQVERLCSLAAAIRIALRKAER
jgi:hypothetical protein